MCFVSAAYTILGTYCASLVRDPNNTDLAQPGLCGVLVAFLIVGAFILNYVRAKVQQANVGGMLSALIMILNLTGAVLHRQWVPIKTVISLLSALAGFITMFLVSLLIAPENSTTVYIQELIKIMEVFDKTATHQVKGFFQPHQQNLMDIGSNEVPESPALVHKKTDALLVSLIDKKRMARREVSFNAISPVDVNELTKIVKKLRVPLHAIAIAHTMDSNMRKMELLQRVDDLLHKVPKESTTGSSPTLTFTAPSSSIQAGPPPTLNHYHQDSANYIPSDFKVLKEEASDQGDLGLLSAAEKPSSNVNRTSILLNPQASQGGSYNGDNNMDKRQSRSVSLDRDAFNFNLKRQEYNNVLQKSQRIYLDLMEACSVAVAEDIKRLARMQSIDPRYQDKPFFYKYLFGNDRQRRSGDGPNKEDAYDRFKDPAIPLLSAIQQFDAQRLDGLDILYNNDLHPRRSLLLILKFQFSLRKYAEILYTLSSLVYEMDRVRNRRRFWLPSVTIWKFFWKRRESSYDLDSPSTLAYQTGNSNLHRTMTQHTALIQSMIDNDAYQQEAPITIQGRGNDEHSQTMDIHQQGNSADINIDMDGSLIDSDDESHGDDDGLPNAIPGRHTCTPHRPRRHLVFDDTLTRQLTLPTRGQVICPLDKNNHTWFHQHDRPGGNQSVQWRRRRRRQTDTYDDDDDDRKRHYATLLRKLEAWQKHLGSDPTANTPSALVDPSSYHDPDASYPATRLQRFFYILWRFGNEYVYTTDTVFALRAATVVTLLTLPGFLNQSLEWYNESRCQWACVVALIWMGPSVGSSIFGTVFRTVGTLVGAAAGLVIWEICHGEIWALLLVTFIVNLPFFVIYTLSVFWRSTGLFCLITTTLIIGYGYVYMATGSGKTVYEVTYYRIASVLVGVAAAVIISVLPYAHTSRVQVRHRIAYILGDIGVLYSSLMGMLLKGSRYDNHIKDTNQKLFRSFTSSIRQQIHVTRALLDQTHYEPALRGVFPEKKYLKLLQVLDTILNMMLQMEMALERVDNSWRLNVVNHSWVERKNTISAFLTSLQLASNALMNKTPLPPYILRPTAARRRLTDKIRQNSLFDRDNIADPNYTYYSTYLMNSEQLAVEIEVLVATVRDLVGSDSVSVMLDYIH
ncbi:hypothetical protein BC941DRAFT_69716 [Chlamydoabsidia padenii]|nr:hypothetical protein BC941DRAFT_69716 [Chlamydoabsidia padenii]